MKIRAVILILLISLSASLHLSAKTPHRYRITITFQQPPTYTWHRTVVLGEDFHDFLDGVPARQGYVPFVAGVIYLKNNDLYCSLGMGATLAESPAHIGKSDAGYSIGGVRHLKIPSSMTFEIPMESGDFKKCTVKITPS